MIESICKKNPFIKKHIINVIMKNDVNFSIEFLKDVIDLYNENKQILKNYNFNFFKYNTLESIYDNIIKIKINSNAKTFINKNISEKYKHLINNETIKLVESVIQKNINLKIIENEIFNKIIIYKNPHEINKQISEFLHQDNSFESKLKELKEKNIEIILEDQDKLLIIANIKSYEDSSYFGSKAWCISRSKNIFLSYLNKKQNTQNQEYLNTNETNYYLKKQSTYANYQFFVWDFKNVPPYDLIGFTYSINLKKIASHLRNDKHCNYTIFNYISKEQLINNLNNYSFNNKNYIINYIKTNNLKKFYIDKKDQIKPEILNVFFDLCPDEISSLINEYPYLINTDLRLNSFISKMHNNIKSHKFLNLKFLEFYLDFFKDKNIDDSIKFFNRFFSIKKNYNYFINNTTKSKNIINFLYKKNIITKNTLDFFVVNLKIEKFKKLTTQDLKLISDKNDTIIKNFLLEDLTQKNNINNNLVFLLLNHTEYFNSLKTKLNISILKYGSFQNIIFKKSYNESDFKIFSKLLEYIDFESNFTFEKDYISNIVNHLFTLFKKRKESIDSLNILLTIFSKIIINNFQQSEELSLLNLSKLKALKSAKDNRILFQNNDFINLIKIIDQEYYIKTIINNIYDPSFDKFDIINNIDNNIKEIILNKIKKSLNVDLINLLQKSD